MSSYLGIIPLTAGLTTAAHPFGSCSTVTFDDGRVMACVRLDGSGASQIYVALADSTSFAVVSTQTLSQPVSGEYVWITRTGTDTALLFSADSASGGMYVAVVTASATSFTVGPFHFNPGANFLREAYNLNPTTVLVGDTLIITNPRPNVEGLGFIVSTWGADGSSKGWLVVPEVSAPFGWSPVVGMHSNPANDHEVAVISNHIYDIVWNDAWTDATYTTTAYTVPSGWDNSIVMGSPYADRHYALIKYGSTGSTFGYFSYDDPSAPLATETNTDDIYSFGVTTQYSKQYVINFSDADNYATYYLRPTMRVFDFSANASELLMADRTFNSYWQEAFPSLGFAWNDASPFEVGAGGMSISTSTVNGIVAMGACEGFSNAVGSTTGYVATIFIGKGPSLVPPALRLNQRDDDIGHIQTSGRMGGAQYNNPTSKQAGEKSRLPEGGQSYL